MAFNQVWAFPPKARPDAAGGLSAEPSNFTLPLVSITNSSILFELPQVPANVTPSLSWLLMVTVTALSAVATLKCVLISLAENVQLEDFLSWSAVIPTSLAPGAATSNSPILIFFWLKTISCLSYVVEKFIPLILVLISTTPLASG